MSEPKAKRLPAMQTNYWRREMLRAMDSITNARGAFHYRAIGEGRELLDDRPGDRKTVCDADALLAKAENAIREAYALTRGLDLNFS